MGVGFFESSVEIQKTIDGDDLRYGRASCLSVRLCCGSCDLIKHPLLRRDDELVDQGGDIQRDVGARGDVVSDDVSPAFRSSTVGRRRVISVRVKEEAICSIYSSCYA